MNADRIKEIQNETGYPESRSVQKALMKVWNECEQSLETRPHKPIVIGNTQPKPRGTGKEIGRLVLHDIQKRIDKGVDTYGEPLKAHNGRNALLDAYEEALDLAIYLRQVIEESQ